MGNAQARRDFRLQATPGFAEEAQERLLDGNYIARVLSNGQNIGDEAVEYALSPSELTALQRKVEECTLALSSGVRSNDPARTVVQLLERLQGSFVSAPWFAACLERRLIVLAHAHECMVVFPTNPMQDAPQPGADGQGRKYLEQMMTSEPFRGRSDLYPRIATVRQLIDSGLALDEPREVLRMVRVEFGKVAAAQWYSRFAPTPPPRGMTLHNMFDIASATSESAKPGHPARNAFTPGPHKFVTQGSIEEPAHLQVKLRAACYPSKLRINLYVHCPNECLPMHAWVARLRRHAWAFFFVLCAPAGNARQS